MAYTISSIKQLSVVKLIKLYILDSGSVLQMRI